MSKKKNRTAVVTIRMPLPKKWEFDAERIVSLYEATCEANDTDYELTSFINGFLLGFGLAEDDEKAEMFFERKEEEDD